MNRLGTITAGSSNFDCNNARCWNPLGLLRFQLHFTCSRYLVSFVRGTCVLRLCCRFHRQESGFRRCDLKIEVARDFYVSKAKNQHFLGCLSTSRLLEESSLRRVTVADCALAHELHRLAESNFRFVPHPVAQTQCPSTSRRPSLKSPFRFQSCPAQELSST